MDGSVRKPFQLFILWQVRSAHRVGREIFILRPICIFQCGYLKCILKWYIRELNFALENFFFLREKRRKFNTAVLFSIALLIIFFSFFFAKLYKRKRIEKNSLVSRLLPRGIYCSLSSICHLKRTVWVNRPSTSFRQVTLESKGAPRRVKSSENSEWIATTKSFLRPKCPLQRSIDDDSLDLEWISRFSSRLEVPCFFLRSRKDSRRCKERKERAGRNGGDTMKRLYTVTDATTFKI